eukprot:3603565-Pyramimonas_sp.AAC.1
MNVFQYGRPPPGAAVVGSMLVLQSERSGVAPRLQNGIRTDSHGFVRTHARPSPGKPAAWPGEAFQASHWL